MQLSVPNVNVNKFSPVFVFPSKPAQDLLESVTYLTFPLSTLHYHIHYHGPSYPSPSSISFQVKSRMK